MEAVWGVPFAAGSRVLLSATGFQRHEGQRLCPTPLLDPSKTMTLRLHRVQASPGELVRAQVPGPSRGVGFLVWAVPGHLNFSRRFHSFCWRSVHDIWGNAVRRLAARFTHRGEVAQQVEGGRDLGSELGSNATSPLMS